MSIAPDQIAWWWVRPMAEPDSAHESHAFRGTLSRRPVAGQRHIGACGEERTLPSLLRLERGPRIPVPQCEACERLMGFAESAGIKVISNPAIL